MCNLYAMTRSRDEVRLWFGVSDNRGAAIQPLSAIFPGHKGPVVKRGEDGERELAEMSWGFVLPQPGKTPRRVTNVRDDTVLTSRFWRPAFESRRCLVPVSSYCEPDSNKPAGWHWFTLNDETEERPLFAFPGIWQRFKGALKKVPADASPEERRGMMVDIEVYAFMTTTPNALTSTIMHDRMPALLSSREDCETWLTGSAEEAYRVIRTYPAERMKIVQSGAAKKDLLRPAVSADERLAGE